MYSLEDFHFFFSIISFFFLIFFFFFKCTLLIFLFSRQYATSKRCLKNLVDSDCNFPALAKEVLELGYGDYNPFCANNRDPGATGNDQCYGVQDKSGDALKYFNAAAGIKSSVL